MKPSKSSFRVCGSDSMPQRHLLAPSVLYLQILTSYHPLAVHMVQEFKAKTSKIRNACKAEREAEQNGGLRISRIQNASKERTAHIERFNTLGPR